LSSLSTCSFVTFTKLSAPYLAPNQDPLQVARQSGNALNDLKWKHDISLLVGILFSFWFQ